MRPFHCHPLIIPTLTLDPSHLTLAIPTQLLRLFSCSSPESTTRVALYLHRARQIDALRLRLRSHDPSTPFTLPSSPIDSVVATQALRSAPSPDIALSFFHSLQSHSHHTLHALAKKLSISGRVPALRALLESVDGGTYPNSLPPSPMDRLRWYSLAGDLSSSIQTWNSIRDAAAAAGSNRRHPCAESYNLIMAVYIANGMDADAVGTFAKIVEEGANPNSRTYTVIIEHLARAGKLDAALKVFDHLSLMRIRRTSKQFNVLAEGFSSAEKFDEIKRLIGEMKSEGILPGRAVRTAMVKMREAGCIEGTEDFAVELLPDERIGYVVASGENSGSEDEDENSQGGGEDFSSRTRLKPWLDPISLAGALSDWDPREVSALEEAKFIWTTRLVCKLLRAFKKPESAWEFFCWVAYQPGNFTHDRQTVSRMISILARNGHVELVEKLLVKVKNEGILLPFGTVRLVVDFYGLSKKPEAAMKVFRDVNSLCGPVSNSNRGFLYCSLLRTLAKCRRSNEVMELLEEMIFANIHPDLQTFSGLMQFFALVDDLKSVHKLFGIVRQCGLEPDSYMYQVLIRACIKHERSGLALRVFEDIRNSNLVMDTRTKALLVKSLWNEGKFREAASVEERCEEVKEGLPAAIAGHVWTVSSANLKWVHEIYKNSFAEKDV